MSIDDLRLCYVNDPWCWFTSDFENQWGDDWDDAPYDCNAGNPYQRDGVTLYKVAIDTWLEPPFGKPYLSVQEINQGAAPWLSDLYGSGEKVEIPAGVTLREFRELIAKAGGVIYEAQP